METLARVLVANADLRRARSLATRLAARGYATIPAEAGTAALKTLREAQPDLVLVDAGDDGSRAIALAEGVKSSPDTRHVPVAILAPKADMQFRRACLAAGADDVITGEVSDAVLVARLTPLIRLATMTNELRARHATLRDMKITSTPSKIEAQSREPSVLMMANDATAPDGRAVSRALADDCSVSFSSDVFEAAELLTEANFDALAISCEDEVERTLYLCSHIRNNPRLFNLPILVMADKDSFLDPAVPYQRGASLVLSRPLDPAELHDQVLSLTRRQRTIYNVRRQLADTLCDETRDPPTGLFARSLFASHLSRLIETAGLSQKPLSLVLFEVENVAWFERQFGEAARARALHQVARWIAGLVRAEDMPARVEDSAIAVALPDTGREEALVVAHRIAGVLLNTDFTVEDSKDADPLRVWLGTGTASAEPGDTVDGLIARARSHLR